MSGIGMAVAAGIAVGGSPPPTFGVSFGVNSSSGGNVSGASGTAAPFFFGVVSNATDPTTRTWTVLDDGGGKLGISGSGNTRNVTYSGMLISEHETITVQFEVSDSAGNYFIDSASISVVRVS